MKISFKLLAENDWVFPSHLPVCYSLWLRTGSGFLGRRARLHLITRNSPDPPLLPLWRLIWLQPRAAALGEVSESLWVSRLGLAGSWGHKQINISQDKLPALCSARGPGSSLLHVQGLCEWPWWRHAAGGWRGHVREPGVCWLCGLG